MNGSAIRDIEPGTEKARVVLLSGGIGGAKLALGLADLLGDRLTVAVNTGDDFEHLGLHVSPDVDTHLYTLSGRDNPELGWGRRDETWSFMAALAEIGGPQWFRLGDRDLALHIDRTQRRKAGETLTAITERFARAFGIAARIVPMSDDPVRTTIETEGGWLAFQEYFVARRAAPRIKAIFCEGASMAHPSPALLEALGHPRLAAILIAPSNPYLSIDPILRVAGLEAALKAAHVPIVAVSPIIGGEAVKGPTAKIMRELDIEPHVLSIATHYAGLIDGLVLDTVDAGFRSKVPMATAATNTLMRTRADKVRVAETALALASEISARRTRDAANPGGRS